MGKMIYFITALIFIELLLLTTGQICNSDVGCSLTSIIFNAVLNPTGLTFSTFFTELIGNVSDLFSSGTGIASLLTTTGIIAGGLILSTSEQRLYIPIAFTLGLVVGDFVFLMSSLGMNPVLSAFILTPLSVVFLMTTVEWLRGKD